MGGQRHGPPGSSPEDGSPDYLEAMALLHDATITPGKRDLVKGWLPSRAWFDGDLDGRKPVASFRFDDPAGEVGVECFLMGAVEGSSASTLLVPMSYRGAPLDGAEEHLIGTTQHSVLGPRWVYDGCGDPVAVSAILHAILTGGHEAELTIEQDGRLVTLDPTCRVSGSGTASEATTADTVRVVDPGDPTVTRAGDLELVVARVVGTPVSGEQTLTAQWGGHDPVVLAAARRARE
jgi:maltokinase-like protein